MSTYFLYFIPHPLHQNDKKFGYIGVAKDVEKRFEKHSKSKTIVGLAIRKYEIEFNEVQILAKGSLEEIRKLEHKYRPDWNIGWNIAPGGHSFTEHEIKDHFNKSEQAYKNYAPSNEAYSIIEENHKNCPFCGESITDISQSKFHFANCEKSPNQTTFINGFDIDGVINMGEFNGLTPGQNDVIITGRSFEEKPETFKMLKNKGINNDVFFNPLKFDEKTRKSSGIHKANTIFKLFEQGITVQLFFEDDIEQMRIEQKLIKQYGLKTQVIWVNHGGIVEKENVRHEC